MRRGPHWFEGSADAVLQNMNLIESENPDLVCVFGADHIYRMDPRQMIADHMLAGGGATVAALPVPVSGGSAFGIIEAGPGQGIAAFHKKPAEPPTMPGDPAWCLASMGNYVFDELLSAFRDWKRASPTVDQERSRSALARMVSATDQAWKGQPVAR